MTTQSFNLINPTVWEEFLDTQANIANYNKITNDNTNNYWIDLLKKKEWNQDCTHVS